MENRRKNSISGDTFSFPNTPSNQGDQDSSGFEFECLSPNSPSTDPNRDSPADHLFFNGRLLPHSFPPQPKNQEQPTPYAFAVNGRTSSRDSLTSSRSNSTNSRRSSTSSSGRTSWSDNSNSNNNNSERRRMLRISSPNHRPVGSSTVTASNNNNNNSKVVSSQRWQYIIPVLPGGSSSSSVSLKRTVSRRSRNGGGLNLKKKKKTKKKKKGGEGEKVGNGSKAGGLCWLRRFIRCFLLACKQCHAMEPSKKDDYVIHGITM